MVLYKFKSTVKATLFILSPIDHQTGMAPPNTEKKPSTASAQLPVFQALIKPEDLEPVEPGSSLKTLRTLRKPREVPDHFRTSYSLIGAVNDGPFTSSKCCFISSNLTDLYFSHSHLLYILTHHVVSLYIDSRAYGIPSVRADLPAPRIKRVSDTNNYGDTSTAADLLHPSVHTLQGVHEEHFFCPRTKKEVRGY